MNEGYLILKKNKVASPSKAWKYQRENYFFSTLREAQLKAVDLYRANPDYIYYVVPLKDDLRIPSFPAFGVKGLKETTVPTSDDFIFDGQNSFYMLWCQGTRGPRIVHGDVGHSPSFHAAKEEAERLVTKYGKTVYLLKSTHVCSPKSNVEWHHLDCGT